MGSSSLVVETEELVAPLALRELPAVGDDERGVLPGTAQVEQPRDELLPRTLLPRGSGAGSSAGSSPRSAFARSVIDFVLPTRTACVSDLGARPVFVDTKEGTYSERGKGSWARTGMRTGSRQQGLREPVGRPDRLRAARGRDHWLRGSGGASCESARSSFACFAARRFEASLAGTRGRDFPPGALAGEGIGRVLDNGLREARGGTRGKELSAAVKKVGELSMENELLKERCHRSSPLALRKIEALSAWISPATGRPYGVLMVSPSPSRRRVELLRLEGWGAFEERLRPARDIGTNGFEQPGLVVPGLSRIIPRRRRGRPGRQPRVAHCRRRWECHRSACRAPQSPPTPCGHGRWASAAPRRPCRGR